MDKENWGCEICGKQTIELEYSPTSSGHQPFKKYLNILLSWNLSSLRKGEFKFKKSNGETLIKSSGEKMFTCNEHKPEVNDFETLIFQDGYKFCCKSCKFIADYDETKDIVEMGWEHLDNSPSCVKFGKNGLDDSYLASRRKCRDCGKDADNRIRGGWVRGVDHESNGPWEFLCHNCSTFGKKLSPQSRWKTMKCKDWETIKKRVRDEAVYVWTIDGGAETKWYDKDKKEIPTKWTGMEQYMSYYCDKCKKTVGDQNGWGDKWVMERHRIGTQNNLSGQVICLINEQSNLPQNNNQTINTLQQLQVYLTVNNIQSITQQSDGSLLITFNSNNSVAPNNNSTSPNNPANSANSNPANPSQPNTTAPNQHIITNEQLTNKNNSSMDAEQRVMWKNFKDYLKAQNKNSLNKEELKQEIKRLETNTSTKRNHAPIIIRGGLILAGIVGLVILFLTKNKKKDKKYE